MTSHPEKVLIRTSDLTALLDLAGRGADELDGTSHSRRDEFDRIQHRTERTLERQSSAPARHRYQMIRPEVLDELLAAARFLLRGEHDPSMWDAVVGTDRDSLTAARDAATRERQTVRRFVVVGFCILNQRSHTWMLVDTQTGTCCGLDSGDGSRAGLDRLAVLLNSHGDEYEALCATDEEPF